MKPPTLDAEKLGTLIAAMALGLAMDILVVTEERKFVERLLQQGKALDDLTHLCEGAITAYAAMIYDAAAENNVQPAVDHPAPVPGVQVLVT